MCANVTAEGEDCGEVYLEDLFQPSQHHPYISNFVIWGIGIRKVEGKRKHLIPIIIRKLRTRMPPLNPCTIDKNIDLMSILENCRSEGCYIGL